MAVAYRYIRFSSQAQSKSTSYKRQLYAIQEWIEKNPNIEISSDSFEDLGLSGYKGEHLDNAFGRLLAAIENNKIVEGDYILIEAVDRMGRLEPLEMISILTKIIKAGISIVTLDDLSNYNRESLRTGLLQFLVGKFEQAHNYSRTLSRRVERSWAIREQKAKAGEPIKMRTPFWLDKNQQLIPEYAEIIKLVFEWYLLGDGQRLIQRRLSERWPEIFGDGFRQNFLLKTEGNRSKIVNAGTVKKWLANKVVMGYWRDIPKVFPPAISQELFYKVQNALSDRTKRSSKPHHYFIGGLAKCRCGSNLSPIHNKDRFGNISINCRCTNRGRLGYKKSETGEEHGCNNSKTIPAVVLDVIAHWCLTDVIRKFVHNERYEKNNSKISVYDGQIAELTKKIDNLLNLVQEGIEQAVNKVRELDSQKKMVLAQKNLLINELGDKVDTIEFQNLISHEKSYRSNYTKFNRLLQQFGYRVVCDDYKITVHIPDEILGEFKYLGYERNQGKPRSNMFQILILKNEKIVGIPRDEPITKIRKDVDLNESQIDDETDLELKEQYLFKSQLIEPKTC